MDNTEIDLRILELKRKLSNIWGEQMFIEKYSNLWSSIEEKALRLVNEINILDEKRGRQLPANWQHLLYNGEL